MILAAKLYKRCVRVLPRGGRLSLVVGVVVLVALAVGGGSSASDRGATATPFELQKPACSAQYVPLGRACVNKTSLLGGSTQWVVSDGSAKWTAPGQYEVSYSWNVPQTISGSGGLITISATAKQLSGTNRICPGMAAKGGLAVPTGIGFCAEAGETAQDSKPVKLATFTAAAGTTADLVIGIQDGPEYVYRYRAAATPAPPAAAKKTAALTWASDQVGSTEWSGRCERFVETAYGARQGYASAAVAAKKIGLRPGPIASVPAGALIYFRANCPGATGKSGHTGISLGGGKMISALGEVVVTDLKTNARWRQAYSGWTYPPATWPGRKP